MKNPLHSAYNLYRYHGAIGYLSREQKHTGQAEQILSEDLKESAWLACTG